MTAESFLSEVTKIENLINDLNESVCDIETRQKSVVDSVSSTEKKENVQELTELCAETDKLGNQIRLRLSDLDRSNDRDSDDYRMRSTQCSSLARKFMQVLTKYQKAQVSYRKEQESRMEREYRIVYPDATEVEMRTALSENNERPIFTQVLLSSQMHDEAERAMEDVQKRHTEVVRLAQSIALLQQLFLDMQTILKDQEHLVISVGKDVGEATSNTIVAEKEISQAVYLKRLSKKKCLYLSLAVTALIVVVILIIYFAYFHPLAMRAAEKRIRG